MREINVTCGAARQIVAAGLTPSESSTYEEPALYDAPGVGGAELRPCRLRSYWTKTEGEGWKAKAVFVDPVTGKDDVSLFFDVYAPAGGAPPEGAPYSWLFYALWNNGRWESIQQPVVKEPCVGGKYISVYDYDSNVGGRIVDNEGVWNVRIPGDPYEDSHTHYLSRKFFRWVPSSLDIVGKKEIEIVAHYETVVTGIVDGVPTTKRILALGEA